MAIDSCFLKDRFLMEAETDPGARRLSDQLQQEVLELLNDGLAKRMDEIVELLNKQGHQLAPYYPEPGSFAFRDDRGGECDLRLGLDIVVSVGFRDTVADDSGIDET
jgi:hypothetical protein